MASAKEQEAKGEALPSYAEVAGPSATQERSEPAPTEKPQQLGPTVSEPFNFPRYTSPPPPTATSSAEPIERAIAIPQAQPDPAAPFLLAYPEPLLRYGIPGDSWRSFLETMSAFLTAKVSDRALAHASDIAKKVGDVPKSFGKSVMDHAKSVGNGIKDNAKQGNYAGAVMGTIGGLITLPVGTAFRAAGAVISLPGHTLSAVASKPKTPFQRVSAYCAVANNDWFHPRGLHAMIMDMATLSEMVGAKSNKILEASYSSQDRSARGQFEKLGQFFTKLVIPESATLELGNKTLWLVVVPEIEDKQ